MLFFCRGKGRGVIVHIVSTGDEVVLGDIADTNAAHLCRAMKELGLSVQRITAVGDEVEQISSVLREISTKADICLVTGGLGPTSDDVTELAFSRAAGAVLQTDRWGLINHNGTAPGFYTTLNRCLFFFMPGVPSEMKLMLEKEVVPVLKERYGRLENKVVSDKGLGLAQEVGRLLSAQGKTLAIAESCTGGLISSMITDVAGSSGYFLFSAVTYSNEAKVKILNVREKTLLDHGAVHERTALEMAEGVRLKAGADFGISTTGIAGPGGGSLEKPVGMVCIGLAGDGFSLAKTYRFTLDDRAMNKMIFAHTAIDLLRRYLTGLLKTS
jgi:PncC family amidohydrolase